MTSLDLPPGSTFDPQTTDRLWTEAVDNLLAGWAGLTAAQRETIAGQVSATVEGAAPAGLADLRVPATDTTAALYAALVALLLIAAALAVIEALAQGVGIPGLDLSGRQRRDWRKGELTDDDRATLSALVLTPGRDAWLHGYATTVATTLAEGLRHAAAREALRVWTDPAPGATWEQARANGDAVAAEVDGYLAGLSESYLRGQLGGALHMAVVTGRAAVLELAPDATYTAAEVLDRNGCEPCREVDGTEYATLADAHADYRTGGYFACLGRLRCRGLVVAVWSTPEG